VLVEGVPSPVALQQSALVLRAFEVEHEGQTPLRRPLPLGGVRQLTARFVEDQDRLAAPRDSSRFGSPVSQVTCGSCSPGASRMWTEGWPGSGTSRGACDMRLDTFRRGSGRGWVTVRPGLAARLSSSAAKSFG